VKGIAMKDTTHADVTLGASTVFALAALALLLVSYLWMASSVARMVRTDLPTAIRAASFMRY
jgi:hypothetical protein